ncbi:MAG: hypothetical protein OXH52_12090, partial [Gammaproteobacteria bacterium]|nr:hypothetical protein [Gammaproteobacteria bacterium]
GLKREPPASTHPLGVPCKAAPQNVFSKKFGDTTTHFVAHSLISGVLQHKRLFFIRILNMLPSEISYGAGS